MRLTLHTDYALRMLMHLEAHRGRAIRVADVADSYGLSRSHLMKVALHLGRLGYVTTLRGRTGGITLAKDAHDINLGAVVRDMEDDLAVVECLRENGGGCVIAPACRLKGIAGRAIEAFLSVFDEYSLADITENRTALAQLLLQAGPNPAAA